MTRTAVAYLRPPDVDPPSLNRTLDLDLDLVAVVAEPDETGRERLSTALERIVSGQADTLFLTRLGAAAASLEELNGLLDWLDDHDASLLAADLELDTASANGRQTVALLREIEGWAHQPHPDRHPRGRPGLASGSPELAALIAQLRERGLSLQAIAETLNARGVPTPRGGARWRPSSVQAALGYRRPRPPHRGALPPRPPGRPHNRPPPPRP